MAQQIIQTSFSAEEIETFKPIMKIGLLATISPEGLPHLTLLSSLKANTKSTLTWGQFTEGMSFENVRQNPKIGWLILTLDKDLWRGTATFTHTQSAGADFDDYNNVPMFRYNAYFGIHTVYYMDLIQHSGKTALPMPSIILSAIKTIIARPFFRKNDQEILNPYTKSLFNKLDNLKFLSYVKPDGFPAIIPVIQAQSAGGQHLIFNTGVFMDELKAIPSGVSMALFGLSLDMTDVLVRGVYQGSQWIGPTRCGVLSVDWVYNPMPPIPQQIYPPVPLEPVRDFDLR